MTLGVGWDESYIFYSYSLSIGIALSASDDVGLYISESNGFVFFSLGYSFFGEIGFSWDYDDIEGDSYEIGVGFELSCGISLSWEFDSDNYDNTGFAFGFEFGSGISSPLTLELSGVETILIDLSDYLNINSKINQFKLDLKEKRNERKSNLMIGRNNNPLQVASIQVENKQNSDENDKHLNSVKYAILDAINGDYALQLWVMAAIGCVLLLIVFVRFGLTGKEDSYLPIEDAII